VEFDRLDVPFELPLLLSSKRHAVLKAGLRFLSAVCARAHVVPVDGYILCGILIWLLCP